MSYRSTLLLTKVPSKTYINVSDSGTGSDSVPSIALSVSDPGSGSDSLTHLENDFTAADSGSASEWVAVGEYQPINVYDTGAGVDASNLEAVLSLSDAGAGSDSVTSVTVSFTIQDAGSAAETLSLNFTFTVVDLGVCVDVAWLTFWYNFADYALGVDFTYLTQGQICLDGTALPHVQSVSVDEPSIVQDLAIMDALPYRRQIGKKGRSLKIQGWTDSLVTLETLREYADGQKHFLLLPTGDSMYVLISDVQTPEDVANYFRYDYILTAVEAVD